MKPAGNTPCLCGSAYQYHQCCGREKSVVIQQPTDADIDRIVGTFTAGDNAGLIAAISAFVTQYPHAKKAQQLLAVRLQSCWQADLTPHNAKAYCRFGGILQILGQHEGAIVCYRRAITIEPDLAPAHYNLGTALQAGGKLEQAVTAYRQAITLMPTLVEAHINLGNTLLSLDETAAAAASLQKAIALAPERPETHYNLGNVLADAGMFLDATPRYLRALDLHPGYVEAQCGLANTLCELGRYDEAIVRYRAAIALDPGNPDLHNNLGRAQLQCLHLDEAYASYREALKLNPAHANAHNNLGVLLLDRRDHNGAIASFQSALALDPCLAEAEVNMGNALRDLGRLDDAQTALERALAIKPDDAVIRSNLLFLTAYHSTLAPARYLDLARNWERHCIPAAMLDAAHKKVFTRAALRGRRLKVGYVSGDFMQHPVSCFIEQLFACHDRTRVELFAYSANPRRDDVTTRISRLVDHWIPVAGTNDDVMLANIDAQGIDVLVDLSGHTAHNRMGVFARRAAPVQATYLGYFASTGLTAMDYLIGDKFLTPAATDDHFTESVWRLPRLRASYDGRRDAPAVRWSERPDGGIYVGSFNNLGKLTAATFGLWAKLLHALPRATLLLKTKALNDTTVARRIYDTFGQLGIVARRIELTGSAATPTWEAHMDYYNRLDIALDPVGAHGGYTTTCDALWMGVPVIAITGDRMASRMTGSILHAVGHAEWLARDEKDYIDTVVTLAQDVDLRRSMRTRQRDRVAASPLCDAHGLACSLEDAYEEMFRRWQLRAGSVR